MNITQKILKNNKHLNVDTREKLTKMFDSDNRIVITNTHLQNAKYELTVYDKANKEHVHIYYKED